MRKICSFLYKQPKYYVSNIKNGLKLANQPPTWMLMQKILVELSKNFTFSILSPLKLNFSTTFLEQLNCVQ